MYRPVFKIVYDSKSSTVNIECNDLQRAVEKAEKIAKKRKHIYITISEGGKTFWEIIK